jgi:hypothetical protein
MIYKLTFTNGRIDWCTAKDELHLLKSYDSEFDLIIQDVEDIQEITTEEAKTTMISNLEYVDGSAYEPKEWTLFELATSDQFSILATNEPD